MALGQRNAAAWRLLVGCSSTRSFTWRTQAPRTVAAAAARDVASADRDGSRSSSRGRDDSRSSFRGRDDSRSSFRGDKQRSGRARDGQGYSRQEHSSQQEQQQRPLQQQQRQGQRPPPRQQQQQQQQRWQQDRLEDTEWQREDDDDYDDDRHSYRGGDDGFIYPARASKASFKEALFGEALYGVAPILAALTAGTRVPHVLLVQEGLTPSARKDAKALGDIRRMAEAAGAAFRTVSKHELNMLSGNRPHQGLILDASPLQWNHMDELPLPQQLEQQQQWQQQPQQQTSAAADANAEQDNSSSSSSSTHHHPVWLALDEVVDPQNLGAMLRSAYCLGASGVLACSRNCSPLTPVVSKASAGAAELMQLHSCRSMPRTLADAAAKGWAVVGAAAEDAAVPLAEFKVDRPTVLVMGNEGYGLRPMVKRCCTQLVQIEMAGAATPQHQLVDSLNVSVATGILLHQLVTTAKA